jgi:hypothetical protein
MTEISTTNVEAFKTDTEELIESPESNVLDESIIEVESIVGTNGTNNVKIDVNKQESIEIMEINETDEIEEYVCFLKLFKLYYKCFR